MKTKIRCLLCAMLCVCLGLPTAFAATITPSVTQISLPKGETTASFDLILTVDKAFAGAEFGLKPSADDVTLVSLTMLDQIGGSSPVQADRNGIHYFGFFTGSNAYQPGTYKVARLTYRYTGSAARTVTLASSKIVTVNEGNKTTEGDTSTQPFTVTITRAGTTPAGGGGIGGGGGGGGGGTVSPAPGGTTTPGDTRKNPFTDVAQGVYYYDAVQWAVGKKITSGTSATTFTPDGICTRAQTVTFLWRSQGSPKAAGAENPLHRRIQGCLLLRRRPLGRGAGHHERHQRHDVQPRRYRDPRADSGLPLAGSQAAPGRPDSESLRRRDTGRLLLQRRPLGCGKGDHQRYLLHDFFPRPGLYSRPDCHLPLANQFQLTHKGCTAAISFRRSKRT